MMPVSLKKALLMGSATVSLLTGCASGILNPVPNRAPSPLHDAPPSTLNFRITPKSWVTPEGVACDGQWLEAPAIPGTEALDSTGRSVPVPAGQIVYRSVSLQCGSAASLAPQASRPFTPQEITGMIHEEKQTRAPNGMVCSATGLYVRPSSAARARFGPEGERVIGAFGLVVPQGYQMVVTKPFGKGAGYGYGSGINCQNGTSAYIDSPMVMSQGFFGQNVILPRAPEYRMLAQPLSGAPSPSADPGLPGLTDPSLIQGVAPSDKPVIQQPLPSGRPGLPMMRTPQGRSTGGDYESSTRLQQMPRVKVPVVGGWR